MNNKHTGFGSCTIEFTNEREKTKAFDVLIFSNIQFSGIGKDQILLHKKDCKTLEKKKIKYTHVK